MATQSEEERKRTGQVEQGNAKPGETAKDTTVRQQTPEPPRVPVLAYNLYSDSPAITNRGTGTAMQPAQARPNTGTNYVRPQSPQDRLNESYQNSHNRWEAEKARRAQFRADHEGRNEWQQREYEAYDKRLKERRQRIQQFNDNVQRGNFEGMTRISDDNWSKMGEGSATAQSGWKMNADGKTIALDENGKPVRETSYTVEGKIDHNSEENVKNRAALEEWSKNQWRTNFNNGVEFSRRDGGFDTSKLPRGVFDRNGNLDLSKITSQKQMNALMQIMRQDQEAIGAKGLKTNAERAAAQVVKDLKASGLSDEQIAGMSTAQKTAARDQFKLNSASRALEAFYKADAENRETQGASGPVSQSMLDARLALREAGFTDKQVRQMMGGDSSPLRGRLEAPQAQPVQPQAQPVQPQAQPVQPQAQPVQPRRAGNPLRSDNPAAREIEAEVRNQLETGAVQGLPTVGQATPRPAGPVDTGDLAAHRQAMEGKDLNENPFADEDAAEFAARQAEEAARQLEAERAQVKADLADPNSLLRQAIREMGPGEAPKRPGVDNGFDLAAALKAPAQPRTALRAHSGKRYTPDLSVLGAPPGMDPVAGAMMTRGGFNRAGIEATAATFAAPIYATAQIVGGGARAASGDAVGGAIQAGGGLLASGVLGHTARAVTGRRGNPLTTRGVPPRDDGVVDAVVRSRTARAQGRINSDERMVTPQELMNQPGTRSDAEVVRSWDAVAKAREGRMIARYQRKAAAARAEEAKISAAAEKDAAKINAREARQYARRAQRRERLIKEDMMEQMRAITSGRKAKPRRVENIRSIRARAKERQRVNLQEAR